MRLQPRAYRPVPTPERREFSVQTTRPQQQLPRRTSLAAHPPGKASTPGRMPRPSLFRVLRQANDLMRADVLQKMKEIVAEHKVKLGAYWEERGARGDVWVEPPKRKQKSN